MFELCRAYLRTGLWIPASDDVNSTAQKRMIYSDDDVDPVNTKSNLQSTKKLGLTRKKLIK